MIPCYKLLKNRYYSSRATTFVKQTTFRLTYHILNLQLCTKTVLDHMEKYLQSAELDSYLVAQAASLVSPHYIDELHTLTHHLIDTLEPLFPENEDASLVEMPLGGKPRHKATLATFLAYAYSVLGEVLAHPGYEKKGDAMFMNAGRAVYDLQSEFHTALLLLVEGNAEYQKGSFAFLRGDPEYKTFGESALYKFAEANIVATSNGLNQIHFDARLGIIKTSMLIGARGIKSSCEWKSLFKGIDENGHVDAKLRNIVLSMAALEDEAERNPEPFVQKTPDLVIKRIRKYIETTLNISA